MKNYWTYNILAVVFVGMIAGVMGMVWHFSEPEPVAAAPAAVNASPVKTPQATVPSVSSGDALLAAISKMKSNRDESLSFEPVSLDETSQLLSARDYCWTSEGQSDPLSPALSEIGSIDDPIVVVSGSGTSSASSGSSTFSASGGSSSIGSSSLSSEGDSSGATDQSDLTNSTSHTTGGGIIKMPKTILEQMQELRPLPKVHYSYWLQPSYILNEDNQGTLYELARLCHALSISGEWTNAEQVDICVYVCGLVNQSNPEIPSSIGVNFSPWHRKFRQDLDSPIPDQYNHTIFNHSSYQEEIRYFRDRMTSVKEWVAQSNQKYGTDVKVGALLLDCERFNRRQYDPYWNEAMGTAQNDIHLEAVDIFPEARIEWYNRGAGGRKGTLLRPYVVDNLIMTGMSCSLYSVMFPDETLALLQGTCDIADTHFIDGQTPWRNLNVTAWVALNYGFDWDMYDAGVRPETSCLVMPWNYDIKISYRIGSELNSSSSPYDRVEVIVFYPRPFDDRMPNWVQHFIEYCKGAASVDDG